MADALAGKPVDLDVAAARVRAAAEATAPPPATRNLLAAARRRGIPVLQIPGEDHYQLRWGRRQQRLWRGAPGDVSGLGVEITSDQERAKELLRAAGIRAAQAVSASRLSGVREAADNLASAEVQDAEA